MANMLSLSFGRSSLLIFVLLSPALLTMLCAPAHAQSNAQQPVEIRITAKQFEFDPRTITVQKGKPVRLVITSANVDHGFKLEAFGINQKVPAKKTINVEFTPDLIGSELDIDCFLRWNFLIDAEGFKLKPVIDICRSDDEPDGLALLHCDRPRIELELFGGDSDFNRLLRVTLSMSRGAKHCKKSRRK